jgi:hypothetical protein
MGWMAALDLGPRAGLQGLVRLRFGDMLDAPQAQYRPQRGRSRHGDFPAAPLGLDMWIGLPAREEYRVALQFNGMPDISAAQSAASLQQFGIDTAHRLVRAMLEGMTGGYDARRHLGGAQ